MLDRDAAGLDRAQHDVDILRREGEPHHLPPVGSEEPHRGENPSARSSSSEARERWRWGPS
ncbi:hypothetical protein A7982_13635 [Minicystis rosea]|nr:hypothetical protein A7982_13635 [Minicystis rosea]